jgi:hypothetical protein
VLGTAPAVLMTLFALIMTPIVRTMLTKDAMELMLCLSELDSIPGNATTATRFSLEEGGTRTPTRAQAQEREWLEAQAHKREMLETYVAGRFGSMLASLSDPQRLENPAMVGVLEAHRAELDRIRANHPNVSSDETARAAADLESTLRPLREQKDLTPDASSLFFFIFAATSVFGVASAWIFRGGWLLRALGIAVVVERGQEASRLRTLWRGLVTWWPVPVVFYVWDRSFMFADSWSEVRTHPFAAICVFVLSVLFVVGAVYAVLNPERGWQDRLAGTWLVPR